MTSMRLANAGDETSAQSAGGADNSRIEKLLVLEAQVRDTETLSELKYLIANETRQLTSARQVFVHTGKAGKAGWRIDKASSVAVVDRNAPMIRKLHEEITNAVMTSTAPTQANKLIEFNLDKDGEAVKVWPFEYCLFVAIKNRDGKSLGGITHFSDMPFSDADKMVIQRLAGTYAHAWSAFKPHGSWLPKLISKRNFLITLVSIFLIGCIPVPLTVLAPVQIVARDPNMIAAPLDGVIEEIFVKPNMHVEKGELLFRFNAVELQNQMDIAERNVAVAAAKHQRAAQGSFGAGDGRRELAVTKAEYDVALAERDLASARFERSSVRSASSGIVMFSSIQDWIGKPVATGERIMRVAKPDQSQFLIELPVSDAIMLEEKANVRIFLDANPLSPINARVSRQSYSSKKTEQDKLVFPIHALAIEGEKPDNPNLRIGHRGTAQLYGSNVPLAFNLFRKPISAIRQYFGV